jgi:hypothetical protein
MKQIKVIIISIIIGISLNTYGQKFRTMEQYQNYFIENYKTLDKIEGIWYNLSKLIVNNNIKNYDPEIVAIIKEGDVYKQYTLKDGYYSPVSGTRAFKYTTSGYQYNRYYEEENKTYYGEPFYLYNNSKNSLLKWGCSHFLKTNSEKWAEILII